MMKDTLITGRTKKRELIIFLICLFAAIVFNVVSIITYNTPWKELFTQFHVVLLVAFFFYIVTSVLRFIAWLIFKMVKKAA